MSQNDTQESGTLRESLNHEEPWKDEYLMNRLYHEVGMTWLC